MKMAEFKDVKFTNETIDGANMVKIVVGTETLMLTIEQAFGFAEIVQNCAELPGALNHIDSVFEGWGSEGWTDGGTC